MTSIPTPPVRLELRDGTAHLVLDAPGRSANVMDDAYGAAMDAAVLELGHRLATAAGSVRGVVVRSTKRTFFAGGDVEAMVSRPAEAEAWRWRLEQVQRPLRALETCGVPVVAAINGAAMGGGLEVALAAHHRVAVAGDYPVGLPEVTLGVLAAGGGISRTVRMLGLLPALESVLLSGRTHTPGEALALGLVDEVVAGPDELLPAALAWLEGAAGEPATKWQPWDRPGFRLPGATPDAGRLEALEQQAASALPEAPRALLRAAAGGAALPFEESARLEIEQFLHLATRPELAITLRAAFLDRRALARAGGPSVGPEYVDRLEAALRAEVARTGDAGDLADRRLFAVSLAAVAALADGTVGSVAEANVLSVDGAGFPAVLGGAVGHVLHHVRDGTLVGLEGFRERARELATAHGPRFEIPPAHLTLLTHLTEQESP
ncbi:MAG: 3-hydroxyacyl-CoA dehydrogenase [Marmoricola sp.]|nr:3-hydroxyacyl-CoA dehydrogenase [Marmoricola sp.]